MDIAYISTICAQPNCTLGKRCLEENEHAITVCKHSCHRSLSLPKRHCDHMSRVGLSSLCDTTCWPDTASNWYHKMGHIALQILATRWVSRVDKHSAYPIHFLGQKIRPIKSKSLVFSPSTCIPHSCQVYCKTKPYTTVPDSTGPSANSGQAC